MNEIPVYLMLSATDLYLLAEIRKTSRKFWRRKTLDGLAFTFGASLIEMAGGLERLATEWEPCPE